MSSKTSHIFISYRRSDSSGITGRIHDRLIQHFEQVYLDVDSIAYGADFFEVIENSLKSCSVLLAIIGKDWLYAADKDGRRIDNPNDLVRHEISTALQLKVIVIPILVDRATIPSSQELPRDLVSLSHRNAFRINHESFHSDVERLITSIKSIIAEEDGKRAEAEAKLKIEEERKQVVAEMTLKAEQEKHRLAEAKKKADEEEKHRVADLEIERKVEEKKNEDTPRKHWNKSWQKKLLWSSLSAIIVIFVIIAINNFMNKTGDKLPAQPPTSSLQHDSTNQDSSDQEPMSSSGNESGNEAAMITHLQNLQQKLEENTTYSRRGVIVFGSNRKQISSLLRAIEINSSTQSTRITSRKFLLWCSNISEEELKALEHYLGITIPLKRDRRYSYGYGCAGGNNLLEIWVP